MFFDRLFGSNYPQLDWIQVEISSYCNASCVYCPHWAFRRNLQNRFLSIQAFRNLVPAFSNTHLVYLQGWGEPFTHPQFLVLCRQSGNGNRIQTGFFARRILRIKGAFAWSQKRSCQTGHGPAFSSRVSNTKKKFPAVKIFRRRLLWAPMATYRPAL